MPDGLKVLTLKRIRHDTPAGTFGVWIMDSGFPMFTSIELPWKNNAEDISCIPSGEYQCQLSYSPAHGRNVYWIQNVPNRKNVEIHIANSIYDLLGCIGVGLSFGVVETKFHGEINGIMDSAIAFHKFMAIMQNDQAFKLVIVDS